MRTHISKQSLGATLLLILLSSFPVGLFSEEAAPPPVVISVAPDDPTSDTHTTPSLRQSGSSPSFTTQSEPAPTTVTELIENAENGTTQITLVDSTGTASIIQDSVVFQGDFSFQLTNPSANDTAIEIIRGIAISSATQLVFVTKFGLLTTDQIAKVQLSTDGGNTYPTTLWSRAGTGSASGGFESIAVDLSAYASQTVHLRFILDFNSGYYYPGTSSSTGWFFDEIAIGESPARPYYSHGDPTDLEQYNLELINRSRADALAEADRLIALSSAGGDPDVIAAVNYFEINPADIRTQYEWAIDNGFIAASAQPLAFNPRLIEAARFHTQDMFENAFQSHTSSATPPSDAQYGAGASLGDRVAASGYSYSTVGESIYSYADSVIHAHAGFLIDWGTRNNSGNSGYNPDFDDQGMQNPPGHRFSNHNPSFQEIGVGLTEGSNGSVGPTLVTQDFGRPGAGGQFITGIVIADFDNDDFYDVGEGLSGVVITAEPADGSTPRPAYRAQTSTSGGYALPVPDNGQYTVTFSHPKYGSASTTTTLSDGENLKVDWIPALLYLDDFGESTDTPDTMELRFFDAGIDGSPTLQITPDLRTDFTEEATATLSPRDESGHRTFSYEKPTSPRHFSRVVIE